MLTKGALLTFVPGTPEIPFRPAETVCTTPPPSGGGQTPVGEWVTVCDTINVLLGWDYGPATWDNPGPFPKAVYTSAVVCRTVWRPG